MTGSVDVPSNLQKSDTSHAKARPLIHLTESCADILSSYSSSLGPVSRAGPGSELWIQSQIVRVRASDLVYLVASKTCTFMQGILHADVHQELMLI